MRKKPQAPASPDDERLMDFCAAATDGLVLIREGRILDCNEQITSILGTTVDCLIGHPVAEFLPVSEHSRLKTPVEQGPLQWEEIEAVRPDGLAVYLEVCSRQSRKFPNDTLFLAVRDITAQKMQRQRMQEKHHRILDALRNRSLGSMQVDGEESYLKNLCRLMAIQCGYSRVEIGLLSEEGSEVLAPTAKCGCGDCGQFDGPADLRAMADKYGESPTLKAIRANRPLVIQDIEADPSVPDWYKKQYRRHGYMALMTLPLTHQGKVFGIIDVFAAEQGAFTPAAKQMLQELAADLAFDLQIFLLRDSIGKSENALVLRTRELEALLYTIPASVYVKDLDQRYVRVNRRFCESFHLTPEQILGRRSGDILPPDLAHQCDLSDRQASERGSMEDVLETYVDTSGKRHWLLSYKSILRNEEQPLGLVCVSLDITARKREELARFHQLEEQKNQLVREVHHRIKNHLQGVVGLLRNRINERPEFSEFLEETVGQVLSIAQVYGLQGYQKNARIELLGLLRSIVSLPMIGENIEWSPSTAGETLYIAREEGVSVALILNELLTNAVKHRQKIPAPSPVGLALDIGSREAMLRIRNTPALLPVDFDFDECRGLGNGLELVHSIMPRSGASLRFWQEGDSVLSQLVFREPLVEWLD